MVAATVGTVAFCSRDACALWAGGFVATGTTPFSFAHPSWVAKFIASLTLGDVPVNVNSDWVR